MQRYHAPHCHTPRIAACACVQGGPLAPCVCGNVWFADTCGGTQICVLLRGLPCMAPPCGGIPQTGPFALKICAQGRTDACWIPFDPCFPDCPPPRPQPRGGGGWGGCRDREGKETPCRPLRSTCSPSPCCRPDPCGPDRCPTPCPCPPDPCCDPCCQPDPCDPCRPGCAPSCCLPPSCCDPCCQDCGPCCPPCPAPCGPRGCFGNFPSLVPSNGCVKMSFFTNQFCADEVIGCDVVIFQAPDRPDGSNCSARLACGNIVPY